MTIGNPPSIRTNFIYRSLLTISNYLMAFITFPYISRILGVSGIGVVNFVDNIVNYFLIFASLGINILGVREIAAAKDNTINRNKVYSNLLGSNFFFTFISIIIFILAISCVPQFRVHSELLYIGISKLLFTPFISEWFYTGIEKFKYITFRSLLVKSLYVIAVFCLVKTPEDYKLYFYLTLLTTFFNAIINFAHIHKYVTIDVKELLNFRFNKQNVILGLYSIMTSMYLTFNVVYLGIVSNDIQVGYYTTAFKLYTVILGIFSAFTNVMLPRMSNLLSNNQSELFFSLISKSFSIVFLFSIPIILFCEVLAPQLIFVLSGAGYEGAILPMRLLTPSVLFVGVAQVLAIQFLMPMKSDRVLLFVSSCGAVLSVLLNLLLTSTLFSVGSSIVMLVAEVFTSCIYIYIAKSKYRVSLNFTDFTKNLLINFPILVVLSLCVRFFSNPFVCVLLSAVFSLVTWLIFIFIFDKEKFHYILRFIKK